ncbi:MAG: hypothetical protein K5768_09895 [Firmicutes bacterium]|nr:hypothetical protein [Bacillota bacterium]
MDTTAEYPRISDNTMNSRSESHRDNDGHHHHHHHSSEEHHHHHHHSSDEHHHHHHSSDEHHHHHHSGGEHNKISVKKFFKSLFLKLKKAKKNKKELESHRLLKRTFILLLILGLFSWSFYNIFIEKLSDEETEGKLNFHTRTEVLNNQLSEAQEEITALKEELAAYKEAFGELDFEPKK